MHLILSLLIPVLKREKKDNGFDGDMVVLYDRVMIHSDSAFSILKICAYNLKHLAEFVRVANWHGPPETYLSLRDSAILCC